MQYTFLTPTHAHTRAQTENNSSYSITALAHCSRWIMRRAHLVIYTCRHTHTKSVHDFWSRSHERTQTHDLLTAPAIVETRGCFFFLHICVHRVFFLATLTAPIIAIHLLYSPCKTCALYRECAIAFKWENEVASTDKFLVAAYFGNMHHGFVIAYLMYLICVQCTEVWIMVLATFDIFWAF